MENSINGLMEYTLDEMTDFQCRFYLLFVIEETDYVRDHLNFWTLSVVPITLLL